MLGQREKYKVVLPLIIVSGRSKLGADWNNYESNARFSIDGFESLYAGLHWMRPSAEILSG